MSADDPMRRFARELRLWARQPTSASPRAARSRLLDAIRPVRAAEKPWRLRLATALVVAVVAPVLFLFVPARQPEKPRVVEPPATQRYLVVTLASGNHLYVQLSPPDPRRPRS